MCTIVPHTHYNFTYGRNNIAHSRHRVTHKSNGDGNEDISDYSNNDDDDDDDDDDGDGDDDDDDGNNGGDGDVDTQPTESIPL
jgi:hypothetical protein